MLRCFGCWHWPVALLSAISLSAAGGCMTPHGFVLRGDWSLEANRVPFLLSNGPVYQSPDCTKCPVVGESGGCPLKSCAAAKHHHAPPSVPPGPRKFHPVPTRPVFEPPAAEPQSIMPVPQIDLEPALPLQPTPLPEVLEVPPLDPPPGGAELVEPRNGQHVTYTVRPAPTPNSPPKPGTRLRR